MNVCESNYTQPYRLRTEEVINYNGQLTQIQKLELSFILQKKDTLQDGLF